MMFIDVTQKLTNFEGVVLKDADAEGKAVDVTLRMAVVNALLAPVQNEKGVEKVKKYEIAFKVAKNDSVDLIAEDITLIKARVGEAFGPMVVGQVYNMLEKK